VPLIHGNLIWELRVVVKPLPLTQMVSYYKVGASMCGSCSDQAISSLYSTIAVMQERANGTGFIAGVKDTVHADRLLATTPNL
jgi:hypothetical protein